jgi:CRISPR-associated protein Csm5
MSNKVKLKISTLTPVTIGSGAELSPYSDYVIDKENVCFIDKTKMQEKIIQKGERYLDLYIQGVAMGIDNNRSSFDLKLFLLNNEIIDNLEEIVSHSCPFIGKYDSKQVIKGLLKSPLQRPYFAGSSIKGAMKTVMMYNWLKTNKRAEMKIEEVIKGIVDNKGYHKEISFDWLEKEFECYVNNQNELIRPNTIQQVTDSSYIAKENIVVVDCYRKMPIRLECIAKGNSAEFELTLDNYNWDDLVKQANKFVEDVLDREFALIEKDDKLDKYYDYLCEIEEEIINSKSDTAYFRLGFGKGYFLNSLGIALYNYTVQEGKKDLYDKFKEFINKNFAKREQDIELDKFPKTRLYVSQTEEPLGWVKIEKV